METQQIVALARTTREGLTALGIPVTFQEAYKRAYRAYRVRTGGHAATVYRLGYGTNTPLAQITIA